MNKAQLYEWISLIPIFIFLIVGVYKLTPYEWREAFILSGTAALIITMIGIHQKILLDRLILGINFFYISGAIGFIFKIYPLLYYYGQFKSAAFLVWVVIVGFITTYGTRAGFIGVTQCNKSSIYRMSYMLLGASGVGLAWSMLMNNYGILIGAILPFIVLKIVRQQLIYRFCEK